MKMGNKTRRSSFRHRKDRFLDKRLIRKTSGEEVPLRSELLSSDQMKQHGKRLAASHIISPERIPDQHLKRLAENERVLIETYSLLLTAVKRNPRIAPAEEWFLDNFYLIEEQIRTAKRYLPKKYSRELPCLLSGPSAGLPRVYDIALEVILHGDGRVDMENLVSFVTSYQTLVDLNLGELWAIPIMLRLTLIENLRRIAARISARRINLDLANYWADRMMEIAEKDPKNLILVIADMARSNPPMEGSFVAELTHRLQGQSPALALPLSWVEQRLTESGLTTELLVRSENQQQAADQVSLSNSIGSLRFLGAMDWREFVETASIVDRVLREDPSGVYGKMDFSTRDHYRHVVEKIAKSSHCSESEVARKAIQLARKGTSGKDKDDRTAHVGYYLIDKGLTQFERIMGVHLSLPLVFGRIIRRFSLFFYLGTIVLMTGIFTWSLLNITPANMLTGWLLSLVGVLSLLGTSQLGVVLTNWLVSLLVKPDSLPRMDFSKGIPPESCTLVVIPSMLASTRHIEDLIEALEVRYLANLDQNLHFCLLTDFLDAKEETMPDDKVLLQVARLGIETLIEKYRDTKGGQFFLLHRPRQWNPNEKVWMGYERKRGKLIELNSFLRGGAKDRFSLIIGNAEILQKIKYVITLDTDTQLPRDSARQCVGAIAHPLNCAQYNEERRCITGGYGVLQPRVDLSLPGSNRSWYARFCSGEPGIDPYTRVVSDIYQDLFGEGSFIGKGIYNVDVFNQVLDGRFPENRILSHDLLEGCYARAGLLSDVQLYEEYPSRYSSDVSRRHRWVRGDWQIASWLLPHVPSFSNQREKNPLSRLSKWKIFDNLRRSLIPSTLMLLFLLGWMVLSPPWFWSLAIIGILLIPSLISLVFEIFRKPKDVLFLQHLISTFHLNVKRFIQAAFTLIFLPYEAFFNLDAILRTAWRLLVTHQKLLEWNPSSNLHFNASSLVTHYREMWVAPVSAFAIVTYLVFYKPAMLLVAGPMLTVWFVSPIIAWWISRPLIPRPHQFTAKQTIFLRKLSRKTWAYFENCVSIENHWLPPDNYQEHLTEAVAHRTSPTNIGLALLANLAAYDFGYLQTGQLIGRIESTFGTMESLERYRGHFYNWYDTLSLQPLPPLYISTVDSGNLAGHLLTLHSGLLNLPDHKILSTQWLDGLNDTFNVLMDIGGELVSYQFEEFKENLASASYLSAMTLTSAWHCIDRLAESATKATDRLEIDSENEVMWWANALIRQCRNLLDELTYFAPWILLSSEFKRISNISGLNEIPTLRELACFPAKYSKAIKNQFVSANTLEERKWLEEIQRLILESSKRAKARINSIDRLVRQSSGLAQMEYEFLFDKDRHLLAIGYNVSEHRRESSFYDLLASEARLGYFVAIAQGQLSQESWFALGRLLANTGGEPVLVSWSGSMFEYLMPLLVMPTYENTLLDRSYRGAVERQIQYGKKRGVPWGISESCYNAIDARLNYQYRAFGVPGLGFKRGLVDDLVIAPYASILALMVAPEEACLNLERLATKGYLGKFGFYEAIDYTSSRQHPGQSSTVVRSFMAHHLGMSILSLSNALLDRPMQKRFELNPMFQATMLLLQERVPKTSAVYSHTIEQSDLLITPSSMETPVRVFDSPDTPFPEVQLLSNGRYQVMVTNSGGGYSRWNDITVTRWREDVTRDNWGTFCYIRDVASGDFWSATFQPTLKRAKNYEVIFSDARAEFRCLNRTFETHTEITVSPEDDIELRRIRITNHSGMRKSIDVTSYAEVVLTSTAADEIHPVFSNLFVQTEINRPQRAILCTRRPRSTDENPPWMFHLMAVHGAEVGEISFETDRMRFIGRGNTIVNPAAMRDLSALSNSQGSVIDPVVAIRHGILLDAGESVMVYIISGVSETRDEVLRLVEKYQDQSLADRAFDLALTHSQVVLRQINATESDAQIYGHLASSIIYANPSLRADPSILSKNQRGQSGLWGYSISGDLPIVLIRIGDPAHIELVRQLLQAHAYWRLKGLVVDLVIWNEEHSGYRQLLHDQILDLIASGLEANLIDRPGGIFVRNTDQISSEDRILFQAVARVIITDNRGTLAEQINRYRFAESIVPPFSRVKRPTVKSSPSVELPHRDLIFFNGFGGFTPDGREYIITTKHKQLTPAPWVNVLSNPTFGTVISESGSSYTWSENAHEFRLSPWYNDPVVDASGEAWYIRDEESGRFWSPTPLPRQGTRPYISRHGFGYSVFEHIERGIYSEMWIYVALNAPIKFTVLKIRNKSGRNRRLSATGFVEWVLGDLKPKTTMHLITEVDPNSGALFARNPYHTEFADRVAFFSVDDSSRTFTCDRNEFLGRNGTYQNPAAMNRSRLSGKVGASLDPCAAIQVTFDLEDGQEREFVFTLGVGQDANDASRLVHRFQESDAARGELESVWQYWNHTLGAIHVETPDLALNTLTNGWLLYQTIACRLWARTGYYQSGGAFGFRDQLQDVMALIHAKPGLVREHLLRCAARQFQEGDVQHWWHPPSGRGVRTHCSDDYLWLPLVTSRYVLNTGDIGVLNESLPFIEGRPVKVEEDSYYDLPERSEQAASLYEHCVRAILRGLSFGEHGLPLIGSGDWNDGMNLVGIQGKGESIWLGFFLYNVLTQFAEVARRQNDISFAELCKSEAIRVRLNIEKHGWDGQWYRRAFFDDGTVLGSSDSPECQIDSIAQSWSILSGAGDIERSKTAMESVNQHLVHRDQALIQLLNPPFDKSNLNPGYIKGYVPGVRENGGQYTHGAIWVVMAFAAMGDQQKTWELFSIINPINHGKTKDEINIYKVEPYVVAADVYALPPHAGRGGWSWYTGSAGWMYQLIVESILGLRLDVDKLRFTPCFPVDWKQFIVHYRYRETVYHITFICSSGETRVIVDGIEQPDQFVQLIDDHQEHSVEVIVPGSKINFVAGDEPN